MAEPRKPRVIRTRNPAGRPAPATPPAAPASPQTPPATPAAAPAAQPAGSVRGTSEKVAVLPVPAAVGPDGPKAAHRVPRPRAGAKKPASAKVAPENTGARKDAAGEAASGRDATGNPAAPRVVRSGLAPGQVAAGQGDSGSSGSSGSSGTGQGSAADGDPAGAQVLAFPMPGHKRRRRTLLLSAAAVVAVLALVMGIALFSPALAVRTVVFDGNKLVSEATLQLAVAPLVSRPLPQVTGEEVSALLESVVQVKSSRIEARPPSTLVVHVVERVPVALLKNEKGFSLVDQDGVELGTTKDPASAGLPLIDGGKAAIGQDTFQAMTGVLATLPKSILAQLANATAKSPDAVELSLVDGRSVIWGNASDMELKAQVLEALLTAPAPTAQEGKPEPVPAKVFDVSAPRHPVTR